MARMWRLLLLVVVWLAVLASSAEDSTYQCYPFSSRSLAIKAEGSNAKRFARQQKYVEPGCPGSSCGAILPRSDIVSEVGTPYEAQCIFDPTKVKAEYVYFQSRGRGEEDQLQFSHTIVDNSTIHMTMNHTQAMKYVLKCMVNGTNVCERHVRVGYTPQDVENFTCISHNWKTLNCSWSVPDNPVVVKYNLTYVVPGFLNTRTCPKMESSDSWCFWNQVHFKRRDQWVMKFLATNILSNVGITYEHKVSTFDSVIPERARNLVAEVRGPREVNLSWTLPHPIDVFPGNVTLEIKYRTRQVGGTVDLGPWHLIDMWEMKPVRFTREILSKEIGQLHPYVEYEFQVRLHTGSGSIRDNMWSQPAHVANITRSTRPTKAPKTSRGTFVVEETKYNRNINLLWQEVDRLYRNAPNFHYVIAVYNNNDDSLHSRTDNITKGYHILRNLSKEVPYRFEVMPVNQEGPPEDQSLKSSVLVREMSAILQTPRYFRVIAFQGQGQTTYSARWRIPDQSAEVESVTLYWCRQLEYENSCKTKLEWKKIDNPTSGAENLTNFDSSTRYLFGISLESRDSSSGIKWISCIANHGDRPPRIEDFSRTYITPTSVGLQWELNCKAQAADPRGFNISYCLVPSVNDTCSSADEKYVLINKESVMMYEVGNLRPFSHYNFNIATVTDVGLSHWSRTLTVTTEADKPSGPPQHLRAKEKGRRWVLLAWAAPLPEDRNGKIVSYEVGGMYVSSARVDAHTRETTHNFTNLDEYTEYTFEVKACSVGRRELLCSDVTGVAAIRTKIGWPGKVGDIEQMSNSEVGWDFDASDCNGPSCSFELRYKINGTTHSQEIPAGRVSVDISGLNISCSEEQHEVSVSMRAVGRDEENRRLDGPWSKKKLVCFPPVIAIWIIVVIAIICVLLAVILFFFAAFGWDRIRKFLDEMRRDISFPHGLDPSEVPQYPAHPRQVYTEVKQPWYKSLITRDERKAVPTSNGNPKAIEEQDLIKPGNERQGRNPSGDSGTSVADNNADSSGCSTGGDSDCSSGSDGIHQSSDSGTVQEDPSDKKWSGEVRFRPVVTSAPPYVCEGFPKTCPQPGYVAVGSVPNLTMGMGSDGGVGSSLPQSTPSLGLEMVGAEVGMGGRRTSTGYISMPNSEAEGFTVPLSDLGNLTLPHERRQGHLPPYSRHYYPYKKAFDLNPPYIKAQSLPWLNDGYVAVAQAEAGNREAPQTQGYVAVGDEGLAGMKRQSSLLSLPLGVDKSPGTPDEDIPLGAYCRVGARGTPVSLPGSSPSQGYVSVTPDLTAFTNPRVNPPTKSPYVTCAMAEALSSPIKQPEKSKYVSVGDMATGRWANPVHQASGPEDTRDVLSAPVEGSRGKPQQPPTRPNTTETSNHQSQRANRFVPLGHSLSKQSSGYASGNVSQGTLSFHDPLLMSPKKLLARSQEPHSVVYSPNHNSSMV